ncbi:MAG: YitT family protein [Clostridia bacterium]
MEKYLIKYPKTTNIVILIFTSFLRAVAVSVFFVPNKIAPGGATGIASIINNLWGWQPGLVTLIVNIPLIALAFFFINKQFVFKTLVATIISSAFTDLLPLLPFNITFTDDVFVATLCGGILWGISLGYLLKLNCSTGGSDIVGLLIQNKFPNSKVVWLIFGIDCFIGLTNGLVFKSLPLALYSVIAIYTGSFIADIIQRGMVSTIQFNIITDKNEEIANFIIKDLHRSITCFKATGMYTRQDKFYLICVVRKRQVSAVSKKIREIDPKAFFYTTSVKTVTGNGFDDTINPDCKI